MTERKYKLTVTLSEMEYLKLNQLKKKTGLSTQAYFLKLFHDIRPKERPSEDFFEVLSSLRRIGNNLRQIALKANAMGFIDTKKYWENVDELDRVISDLKDFMMQ